MLSNIIFVHQHFYYIYPVTEKFVLKIPIVI